MILPSSPIEASGLAAFIVGRFSFIHKKYADWGRLGWFGSRAFFGMLGAEDGPAGGSFSRALL